MAQNDPLKTAMLDAKSFYGCAANAKLAGEFIGAIAGRGSQRPQLHPGFHQTLVLCNIEIEC
jgi:hypothetical protein